MGIRVTWNQSSNLLKKVILWSYKKIVEALEQNKEYKVDEAKDVDCF